MTTLDDFELDDITPGCIIKWFGDENYYLILKANLVANGYFQLHFFRLGNRYNFPFVQGTYNLKIKAATLTLPEEHPKYNQKRVA
jgi:hypothetical protein